MKKITKTLLYVIVFQLVFPIHVQSQEQRNGLFLQDESYQRSPRSFRDQKPELDIEDSELGNNGRISTSSRAPLGTNEFADKGLFYQVHVLGEVKQPGTYRITPTMRLTDALQMAGGIKKNGSERYIELRSGRGSRGQNIDLFSYKTLGQLSQNPYLQDNNAIFVPLKKRAIEVEGPVRRPGFFELKGEENLQDIIDLAGGFTVGLDAQDTIKVVRYGKGTEKQILPVPTQANDMSHFEVEDGDVIIAPHKFLAGHEFDYNLKKLPNDNIFYPSYEDRVFVIGAVRIPGAYDFNQNFDIRQYLTLAGGTNNLAKNGSIKVVTPNGKTNKAKNGIYEGVINPGDTIVVPEKAVPNSFYIGLLPTVASLGLSATALFK